MCPSKPSISADKNEQAMAVESSASHSISPQYSIFSRKQKNFILFLVSFSATFSPLSSFIFFPAIDALSQSLQVSVGKINLTITSYMIVAGIAPAIMGDLADKIGRRVVYLVMMTIYCTANIGLALQNTWLALFILRMLQSTGSAATIALGYGVVSDIASPSERGAYVSWLVLGPNIATAIGPILGGALAGYPGWRWIFWFLSLLSGTCLFLIVLLLPETARSIVGNGSGRISGLRRTCLSCLQCPKVLQSSSKSDIPTNEPRKPGRNLVRNQSIIPNPLQSLKLLWAKDSALITLIFGVFYMNLSTLQASTSTLFIALYDISELQAGLIYLPSGIGSCIGAYGAGYMIDYDYRTTSYDHDITINTRTGDDLTNFPIEKARFRSVWYFISAAASCSIAYGWALKSRVNIAVPLALHFIIGLSTAVIFNMCGTLLVDVHPKSPSTAQAANSIVRAFLAGAGTATLQVLLDAMGSGWTFTIFGSVCAGCLGVAWLEWKYGRSWRNEMRESGVER